MVSTLMGKGERRVEVSSSFIARRRSTRKQDSLDVGGILILGGRDRGSLLPKKKKKETHLSQLALSGLGGKGKNSLDGGQSALLLDGVLLDRGGLGAGRKRRGGGHRVLKVNTTLCLFEEERE